MPGPGVLGTSCLFILEDSSLTSHMRMVQGREIKSLGTWCHQAGFKLMPTSLKALSLSATLD